MGWVFYGFQKLRYFKNDTSGAKNTFSIVVPFRNEEKQLPSLLQSLLKIDYDETKFEVLFVDDESNDASVQIINDCLKNGSIHYHILTNIRYSNSPKKDAISQALKKAQNDWIVTTDADCIVPPKWLLILDAFIQKKDPKMVCMPVAMIQKNSLLYQFQYFDGLSLQTVTKGGFGNQKPLLCNGANLAYKKKTFFEVAGYIDNDIYASGDDLFLMEKIRELYPTKILYLKNREVTVLTHCVDSWKSVTQQRIRWASKTKYLKEPMLTILGGITLLTNLALLASFICCFIFPLDIVYFLSVIVIKILLDTVILVSETQFLRQKFSILYLWISTFIYSVVVVWVVFNSIKGGYEWKDRTFKN